MISNRLKAARLAAGQTQTSLSRATGFSQAHISQMESGDRLPSYATARALATALKVDLGWLLGETPPGDADDYQTDPRAAILTDYQAPPGLRELARDNTLVTKFNIQPDEWRCLRSIQFAQPPAWEGYLSLLLHLRDMIRA